MTKTSKTRRQLLTAGLAATALSATSFPRSLTPHSFAAEASPDLDKPRRKVERLGIGAIGMRYQGTVIAVTAAQYGDVVAIADVDRHVLEQSRAGFGSTPRIFDEYQDLLARDDVDVVTIGSPDHWHVKMAVDACRAGKDVYVEKPISLTIDEGKLLRKVAEETGRVVQVGSWQRSDHRFRLAVELVRSGRIGTLQRVDVVLGKNDVGGPFEVRRPPGNLNWDLWQGQAMQSPYLEERCHYKFRFWYAYAGGQMTDWGAHHLDVAQWAINEYPIEISSRGELPTVERGYDVPINFNVSYRYPSGVEMTVADEGRNGIMFTGTKGRFFVNRGTISGEPIDDLKATPLQREDFTVYAHDNLQRPERVGKLDAIVNHMGNFFDCVESRRAPVSDVESQHRSATTCHLGNLSLRLGRDLRWNPEDESIVDDPEANLMMNREQRQGFEIV